jgi:hypothetical protein
MFQVDILIGLGLGVGVVSILLSQQKTSPIPKPHILPKSDGRYITGYDSTGSIWDDQFMSGFLASFKLRKIGPLSAGALAFTDGLYDKSSLAKSASA